MVCDTRVKRKILALLADCRQPNCRGQQLADGMQRIAELGHDALPCLMEIIGEPDWDQATYAVEAVKPFGPRAAEYAPFLFARMMEANAGMEDMFEWSADEALSSMGVGIRDLLEDKIALSTSQADWDAVTACWRALWILERVAPHDRRFFELCRERLLRGHPSEAGIVLQFLPRCPDFQAEAVALLWQALDTDKGWIAADGLVTLREQGQLTAEEWDRLLTEASADTLQMMDEAQVRFKESEVRKRREAGEE